MRRGQLVEYHTGNQWEGESEEDHEKDGWTTSKTICGTQEWGLRKSAWWEYRTEKKSLGKTPKVVKLEKERGGRRKKGKEKERGGGRETIRRKDATHHHLNVYDVSYLWVYSISCKRLCRDAQQRHTHGVKYTNTRVSFHLSPTLYISIHIMLNIRPYFIMKQ